MRSAILLIGQRRSRGESTAGFEVTQRLLAEEVEQMRECAEESERRAQVSEGARLACERRRSTLVHEMLHGATALTTEVEAVE